MGGDAPQPSRPYQGPDFGLQNRLLSTLVLGNLVGANPHLSPLLGRPPENQDRNATPTGRTFLQNTFNGAGNLYSPAQSFQQPFGQGQMLGQPQLLGNSGTQASNFAPQGFTQAGQAINGQLMPNTTFALPSQTTTAYNRLPQTTTSPFSRLPQLTTPSSQSYSPYQFDDPGANFSQRSPFNFQESSRINVGDTYSPQMDLARRQIEENSRRSLEQQMADLNARGMLTTGAGNRATMLNLQESGRQLADLSSQYSLDQARAQLQEDQLRRQMEQQRQVSQAEEIFRQQGATDQQAQFLAQQNLNLQNAQAGQNLSAFNTNLGAQQQAYGQDLSNYNARLAAQQQAYGQGLSNYNAALSGQQQAFGQDLSRSQLLGQLQNQQFNQALQGRQQGTAEEQLANLMRRQPLEDLFRLWGPQAQPTGGTPGSQGAMPLLGSLLGAGATLGAAAIGV